jgi:DNA-binding transcriptional ArsR family regulator
MAENLAELQANALKATALLKAMSNPARLMVLCQLSDGEKSVGQLARAVGLSQSGLSQHLAILRREGILLNRRDAQTIYYSIASREAAAVMKTLYDLFCAKIAKKSSARARAA